MAIWVRHHFDRFLRRFGRKLTPRADEFRCGLCQDLYRKGWSDEEAAAEAAETFPGLDPASDDADLVCDDCYNLMMGRN